MIHLKKKSTESIHHVDTDNMIRKLRASCVDQKCEKVNIDIGTEQLIAKLQNGSHNNQNAVSSEPNTDQIIDKIFRTQKGGCGCAQSGGKKKKSKKHKVRGQRRGLVYSENIEKRQTDLSSLINKQYESIRKNNITKIKEKNNVIFVKESA